MTGSKAGRLTEPDGELAQGRCSLGSQADLSPRSTTSLVYRTWRNAKTSCFQILSCLVGSMRISLLQLVRPASSRSCQWPRAKSASQGRPTPCPSTCTLVDSTLLLREPRRSSSPSAMSGSSSAVASSSKPKLGAFANVAASAVAYEMPWCASISRVVELASSCLARSDESSLLASTGSRSIGR